MTKDDLISRQPEERTEERTETHACDCISRQAAIEETWKEPSYTDPINVLTEVRDRIKALPSAQPEIIRCKECKHWLDIDDGRQKHRMCADIYGDWFCADAERRTDGN